MNLGIFGALLFSIAIVSSLVFEGYTILNVSRYAARKWNRAKVNPVWINSLDVVYSVFTIALLFTPYWKFSVIILIISAGHYLIEKYKKMTYTIFMFDSALCFILLLTVLFNQLSY